MIEKMKLVRICAFAGFLLVSGCGGNSGTDSSAIAFRQVFSGSGRAIQTSPVITPSVFVLRSQPEWSELFNLFSPTIQPAMPSINFDSEVFVVAVDKFQTTTGHSIKITGVQASSNGITVQAIEESPASNCPVQSWDNQPHAVITVPAFSGTAVLNVTQKLGCTEGGASPQPAVTVGGA